MLFSDNLPFKIEKHTGNLITTAAIDREVTLSYKFPVFVTDSGKVANTVSTTVFVTVSDVNDNPPYFTDVRYTSKIYEDDGSSLSKRTLQIVSL